MLRNSLPSGEKARCLCMAASLRSTLRTRSGGMLICAKAMLAAMSGRRFEVTFVLAARQGEIPEGQIREFQVGGKAVAIANVSGKLFAINSVCLHHGGPLGEGDLEGSRVSCPWHGWQYDVTTGKLVQQPDSGVQCYAVEVRDGAIFVDLG